MKVWKGIYHRFLVSIRHDMKKTDFQRGDGFWGVKYKISLKRLNKMKEELKS